jgi:uncharacterized protein YndB with AHSA1/START domain
MAPIVATIEIDRPQADVFAYVTDPTRFVEWQKHVLSGRMDGSGPAEVGSKCVTTRQIGFAKRPVTAEVTRLDPPKHWAVRGLDGPIRADVNVTVEPLDDARSHLTIAIDFEGRGIGKLIVPLAVRREARKEMPDNLRRAKERLESSPR